MRALGHVILGVGYAVEAAVAGASGAGGVGGKEAAPVQERTHLPMEVCIAALVGYQGNDLASVVGLTRSDAGLADVPVDGVDLAAVDEQVLGD